MIRFAACIITKNKEVLIGYSGEQHYDLLTKNKLCRDEDVIGYFDFHLPNLFVPDVNYYLYDEQKCDEAIEEFLQNGGFDCEKYK